MNIITIKTSTNVTTRMILGDDDTTIGLAAFCLRLDAVRHVAIDVDDDDNTLVRDGSELFRADQIVRAFRFNKEMEAMEMEAMEINSKLAE